MADDDFDKFRRVLAAFQFNLFIDRHQEKMMPPAIPPRYSFAHARRALIMAHYFALVGEALAHVIFRRQAHI